MKLSKRTQKEIDSAMSHIHNGNIDYGCRILSTIHRAGNANERMTVEEYRDNSQAIFDATEIINGCIIVK